MKCISLLSLSLCLLTMAAHSQKNSNITYNKFTEIEGTGYVMATFEDWTKKATYNNHLLFINTANNQRKKIDFPENVYFQNIEQIKIDSLHIHRILVGTRTDYADNKFIDTRIRPQRIVVLSTDGQEKIETPETFCTTAWIVNNHTGALTVAGYYDTNANGKHDSAEENDILIFDLKTLKAVSKS